MMFHKIRQWLCWHNWTPYQEKKWSTGSMKVTYVCEKCLARRSIYLE